VVSTINFDTKVSKIALVCIKTRKLITTLNIKMENTDNFVKLASNLYYAKNENGLHSALFDHFENYNFERFSKDRILSMVDNFPSHYPTSFVVRDLSFICRSVYLECFDMVTAYQKIRKL
jgi:hypothetical protein